MTRHIVRRLIQAIPTLFGVTLLSYMILSAAPGNPVNMLVFGQQPQTGDQANTMQASLADRFGVNDPWPVQYLVWLIGDEWRAAQVAAPAEDTAASSRGRSRGGSASCRVEPGSRKGILRGDFGCSFLKNRPAMDLILERIPATLELGVATLIVGISIGVPLGLLAAIWRGGMFDNFTRIIAVVGNAVPNFWMGLILILVFGVQLDILPRGDRCNLTREVMAEGGCSSIPLYNRLEFIILPTVVLALGPIAGYSRYMRTSMLETIGSDYVRTAKAKGLLSRTVWMRHAARNALIPLATFLGPALVGVLGGAVITETIFNWPGLGRLTIEAINARDYPIIMASVFIGSILTIIAYIISDILYAVFDPRIRF